MNLSLVELKARLLRKSKTGEAIHYRRINCDLVTTREKLVAADLLLLDHTSAYRNFQPAAELLPLGNANEALLQNAERYRELIEQYPVVAGVCGTDPFRIPEKLLQQIKTLGFVGVQNTPSIGLIDGEFRTHLEHSRISYNQEIALLKLAKEMGLLVVGMVFSEQDAEKMREIGADILIVHPGPQAFLHKSLAAEAPNPLFERIAAVTIAAKSGTILLPNATCC